MNSAERARKAYLEYNSLKQKREAAQKQLKDLESKEKLARYRKVAYEMFPSYLGQLHSAARKGANYWVFTNPNDNDGYYVREIEKMMKAEGFKTKVERYSETFYYETESGYRLSVWGWGPTPKHLQEDITK